MKRAKSLFILFFVGLVIGVPSGVLLIQRLFIRNEKVTGMSGEEDIADEFAKLQYLNADAQSAHEALIYAVKIHRQMQVSNAKYWGTPQQVDTAWCLTELSVLEDSVGNSEPAKNYMAQADEMFKNLHAKDATVTRFKQTIRDTLPKTNANGSLNSQPR